MRPIPSSPDTSGRMILPGLDTSTQGVGRSDKAAGATDLTAASLRGSPNIGPIKSPSEWSASEPTVLTAPDLASSTANARDQKNSRYQRKSKMIPNTMTTARNLCAIDWCASHPEGTLGEFNWYYDKLPAEEANVYKQREKNARAAAQSEGVQRNLSPKRAPRTAEVTKAPEAQTPESAPRRLPPKRAPRTAEVTNGLEAQTPEGAPRKLPPKRAPRTVEVAKAPEVQTPEGIPRVLPARRAPRPPID